MRFCLTGGLCCLLSWISASLAFAQSAPVNIMAGPAASTSLQVGNEIQALTASCGMDTTVHQSAGALDNLLAVKSRTYTQFGIIQYDVLEYLLTYEPDVPDIATALRGIKVAFPLFPQEVQVLSLNDVEQLADLTGQRVSIGHRDSGTFLTSTVLLDILGVAPSERLEMDPQTALAALKAGEISAMFFVDGVPSALFEDDEIELAGLKLLPLDDPILSAVYDTGVIPAQTYTFVADDVPTVTVRAVMIAYDYSPSGRNRYNTANCNMVAAVSHLVTNQLEQLREEGHPKWSEVNPAQRIADFEVARCADRGLQVGYPLSCN